MGLEGRANLNWLNKPLAEQATASWKASEPQTLLCLIASQLHQPSKQASTASKQASKQANMQAKTAETCPGNKLMRKSMA